ncbi:DUF3611 family protein [Chamaesiphon sp. GL140_3_metabinner_50]|uniref:DUF3611 family protein n=1 Tax=Chamaesiphon sp. GL140_3_metabinner_50 TaxID=2970812 RepID=UPI0025E29DF4|nr:DUF3611 family protein [Chamaesiphon sp. GL140_3_metabinner_50]
MSDLEINGNTPQTVRKIASQLRRVGWAGFWLQLVLAVVSSLIFLFAIPFASTGARNPGTGGSLIFTLGGLLVLYVSVYWSFRYVLTSRKLKNPDLRPKKADTIKLVQWGLISSIVGMGSSVLAAESISGTLLGKSLSSMTSFAVFSPDALSKIIQPLDILIVLGNTHTITAHFIGIVSALWLLNQLNK